MARAAFFARLDVIRGDLDQGWRMIAVYEKHAAELGVSYSQFTRYVRQYIAKKAKANAQSRTAPGAGEGPRVSPRQPPAQRPEPRKGESQSLETFCFEPMDAYKNKYD
jgi:hypothetical protein